MEDVAWHLRHEYLFGSVGDDQYLLIWDLRTPSVSKPVQSVVAHQSEVGISNLNASFRLSHEDIHAHTDTVDTYCTDFQFLFLHSLFFSFTFNWVDQPPRD